MTWPYSIDLLARRRLPISGLVLLALAVVIAGWQVWLTLGAYDALKNHRAGLGALQRPRPAAVAPTMTAEDSRRHLRIEGLAQYLALPWDALLSGIEKLQPQGTTLRRLDVDAATHQVALVGHVPTAAQIGRYLRAVESEPRLSNVMLVEHTRSPDANGGGFDFGLSAEWVDSAKVASDTGSSRASASAPARGDRP